MNSQTLLLILSGLITGFIDSIAGGGGLISVPLFSLLFGAGVIAVATNKIVGVCAAATALLVYMRKGHMDVRRSLGFAVWTGLSSWVGSSVSPHVPSEWFRYFLLISCPLLLWVIWRKDFWIAREAPPLQGNGRRMAGFFEGPLILAGVLCGFYDGIWGPGGGTFMFLSLLFLAKLPLLTAIAAAKLANTASAGVSLANYASMGLVHWKEGLTVASGVIVGGWFGAHQASAQTTKIVRPMLVVVVSLLLIKLLTTYLG